MPKFPRLSQNERANVVVVGGGIAGLSCAYMLARGGKSVILLEDGELASGETGRTTAHLNTYIDDGYSDIISSHGREAANIVREAFGEAVDTIERIVKEENIDCDFERLDGYLFGKESRIYEELEGCKAVGFPAQLVDGAPVLGERTGKALLLPRQAVFHPLKYLSKLAECITTKYGGKIYTGTHVDKFEGGDAAHVTTSQNLVVSADHIVVATNVPVNDKVEFYLKSSPYRTYAIGVPVPKGSIPKATFYDTDDPYHYVRLCASENPGEEILVTGGEDHFVGHSHNFEEKYQTLYNWTKRFFPNIGPLQYKWSGQVIEPLDGLGYIGVNPMDKANVYVVTGDSGNGMINGTIAGIMLSSMIQGKGHHWSLVFNPSRKPGIHEAKEFVSHNVKAAAGYKDWITGSDVTDIEDIRPGCGAVIRHGLTKEAVYKDLQGKTFSFSAVCPHLGAIVNWNDSEKSWDCPAHGSRFDPYGCVVNGPANQNLTPKPQSST